jgi:hypothetical protein
MHPILTEVTEKFGEWLEMAGDNAPALTIDILCKMIELEREKSEYYKKLFESGALCRH